MLAHYDHEDITLWLILCFEFRLQSSASIGAPDLSRIPRRLYIQYVAKFCCRAQAEAAKSSDTQQNLRKYASIENRSYHLIPFPSVDQIIKAADLKQSGGRSGMLIAHANGASKTTQFIEDIQTGQRWAATRRADKFGFFFSILSQGLE